MNTYWSCQSEVLREHGLLNEAMPLKINEKNGVLVFCFDDDRVKDIRRRKEEADRRAKHPAVPAKSRGLGDTIAKVTKAVGIKPCGGCQKRQAKFNQIFPYR